MKISNKKQHGMALIESLISVLLLAIAVLALVSLQASMSKNVTHTKLRGEAAFLANQLLGQMWVDHANLASYKVTADGCEAGENARCLTWYAAVQQQLPGGEAEVSIDGNLVNITLRWTVPSEETSLFSIDAAVTSNEI